MSRKLKQQQKNKWQKKLKQQCLGEAAQVRQWFWDEKNLKVKFVKQNTLLNQSGYTCFSQVNNVMFIKIIRVLYQWRQDFCILPKGTKKVVTTQTIVKKNTLLNPDNALW